MGRYTAVIIQTLHTQHSPLPVGCTSAVRHGYPTPEGQDVPRCLIMGYARKIVGLKGHMIIDLWSCFPLSLSLSLFLSLSLSLFLSFSLSLFRSFSFSFSLSLFLSRFLHVFLQFFLHCHLRDRFTARAPNFQTNPTKSYLFYPPLSLSVWSLLSIHPRSSPYLPNGFIHQHLLASNRLIIDQELHPSICTSRPPWSWLDQMSLVVFQMDILLQEHYQLISTVYVLSHTEPTGSRLVFRLMDTQMGS